MTAAPTQLQSLETELTDAQARAHRLAEGLTEEQWRFRPDPDRWSIGEQVVHLNLTTRAYLPLFRQAVEEARARGLTGHGPFRRDFVGWLLERMAEPPVRVKVKTTAPFVPGSLEPKETVLGDFDRLQAEAVAFLPQAAGLAIDKVKITSPFDARIRYNLYSALRAFTAHERHHLWLGEQTRARL
ncbi:MAG TPA: DinB family protein [Thermoanaerobaculia bacterium]|nr:DinB family protein [Thermoanaerobaculia bacterium]